MIAPYIRNKTIGFLLFVIVILVFCKYIENYESNVPFVNHEQPRKARFEKDLPIIYMITGTYPRPEQLPELVRLSQTLLHVKNIIWIVCEEANTPTDNIRQLLKETRVNNVYLRVPKPTDYINPFDKSRGASNKNHAIDWIRKNAKSGVIFFGDDDNVYDLKIFEEMRTTRWISMFPVGLLAGDYGGVETPVVKNGKVVDLYTCWDAPRQYPVDFAAFAISVQMLLDKPRAQIPLVNGYEEDYFLQSLEVELSDIEPKCQNCTKVLVWHTQTAKNSRVDKRTIHWAPKFDDSNLPMIKNQMF